MKKIILMLLMIIPVFGFAQSNSKDTVIRIQLDHSKYDKHKKKASSEKNIIKFSPLGFLTGAFPIYYERVVNDFFTVQTGLGLTNRNYVRSIVQQASDNSNLNINYPWDVNSGITYRTEAPFFFEYRSVAPGFMFSIQPRLYFESDAPDGAYLGVSYDFYRYNFKTPQMRYDSIYSLNYTQRGGTLLKEHENISDLMATFGYHDVYDHLSVDYSIGMGIRNVNGMKYYFGTKYDSNSNQIEAGKGFTTYKQTTFNFNLGIKVGYHF
jgi:hypothetical protein